VQPGDGGFGGDALAADALLFFFEQLVRNAVFVVGVEQFPFLTLRRARSVVAAVSCGALAYCLTAQKSRTAAAMRSRRAGLSTTVS
jgi:hypothetical protein